MSKAILFSIITLLSVYYIYGVEGDSNSNSEETFCGSTYRDMEDVWAEADPRAKRIVKILQNPEKARRYQPRYAFFYGEPGCGKTTLAKAIAWKAGFFCDFIPQGEIQAQEKNQRNQTGINLYKRLHEILNYDQPTMIILDEINEYLEGSESDSKDTSFTSKVLWNFLDSKEKMKKLFVIGTMNRGDKLPQPVKSRGEALAIKIEMPKDSYRRLRILKKILFDEQTKPAKDCTDEFLLTTVIENTKEYSARDYQNIAIEAVGQWIDTDENNEITFINQDHIIRAMVEIEKVRKEWKYYKVIRSEQEQQRINFLKELLIHLASQERQKGQATLGIPGLISRTTNSGMNRRDLKYMISNYFTEEDKEDLKEEYNRDFVLAPNLREEINATGIKETIKTTINKNDKVATLLGTKPL